MLLIGGYFSLAFAVFQVSGIFWSAKAIRYFGGPADLATNKPFAYATLCIIFGAIAAVFGFYALSGAGLIRRLPLLHTGIAVITAIYLLRSLLLIHELPIVAKYPTMGRFVAFSSISLLIGLVHLAGFVRLLKYGRPESPASNL